MNMLYVKRFFKSLASFVVVVPLALAIFVWWKLRPVTQNLPLPEGLIAIDTPAGQALLEAADYRADYALLSDAFESQQLISYCGVASGAMVLAGLGEDTTQNSFFTPAASEVRSSLQVTLGGMSLIDLDGLLSAHGVLTRRAHGSDASLDEFRALIEQNLADPSDFLLVNYQREVLGQGRVGHISPLAAYDSASDKVLVLDTAAYKYPFTWVPVPALYAAMQEADTATGLSRGYIVVSAAE